MLIIRKIIFIDFFAALYFYTPITTLYYQARGLNFVEINSIWIIIMLTMFLNNVPTGIIADKIGRKQAIVLALLFQLMGEGLFIFATSYPIFIFCAILAGLGFSFATGCIDALVYDTLKTQKQESMMSQMEGKREAAKQLGFVVATAIGGTIAAIYGFTLPIFIFLISLTVLSVLTALVISLFIKEKKIEHGFEKNSPFTLLKNGLFLAKENKLFQRVLLLSLFTTPFPMYLTTLYQPYLIQAKTPPLLLGLAFSLASLVALFSARHAHSFEKWLGVKKAIFLATIVPGILYLMLALFINPLISFILFCFTYGLMTVQTPLFSAYLNIHIESQNRTTMLSFISMLSQFYIAIIGIVVGKLADIRLIYGFIFMGVIIILGSLVFRIDRQHVLRQNVGAS